MPGGNSCSSKRPYRMLKDGSMNSPDVKALNGAELLADPGYMGFQLKNPPPEYDIDPNFGLSMYGGIDHNQEDTQGTSGWKALSTEGAPTAPASRTKGAKKNSNPFPEKPL